MSLFALPGLVQPASSAAVPASGPAPGLLDGGAEAEELIADDGLLQAVMGMPALPVAQSKLPPRSPEAFALDPNAAGLGFAPRPTLDAGAAPAPAALPADGAAGSNAEAGLSQAQIRANNVAKKYRESQEREMARKRRSGNVWMGVALINAVRRPPLSHA